MTTPPPAPPPRADAGDSVTAMDYITTQLQLESEAREALPFAFDTCTRPMGALRQPVYACRTCTPLHPSAPPKFGETQPAGAAALCYSCSISCHGDHELVEIFEKRGVACDCGTARLPGTRCELTKACGEKAVEGQVYGQNFWGRFCWCEVVYRPELERGTMFQCMLGDACGEDWFHDVCIVGTGPPDYHEEAEKGGEGKEKAKEAEEGGEGKGKEAEKVEPTSATDTTTEPKETTPSRIEVEVAANGDSKASADREAITAEKTAATAPTATEEQDEEDDGDDEDPPPAGFPTEEFEHFICWRCVAKNPWLARYAGTPGFLPAVARQQPASSPAAGTAAEEETAPPSSGATTIPDSPPAAADSSSSGSGHKRKASEDPADTAAAAPKRAKTPDAVTALTTGTSTDAAAAATAVATPTPCTAPPLPAPSDTPISLFLTATFRPHLCRCATCYPLLIPHPILREEEDTYSPPSDVDDAASDAHSSLYDAGERALGSVDRVRAIEGVMAYNAMKDKVKAFLKPFAESGETVGAEAVKAYFEKLRGDAAGGGGSESGGKAEGK